MNDLTISPEPKEEGQEKATFNAPLALKGFIAQREPIFSQLVDLRAQGWASAEGDKLFREREQAADKADEASRERMFQMTILIGCEMNEMTKAYELSNDAPHILDLCMAPGGFTATAMSLFPNSKVDAISLPVNCGGYKVMARGDNLDVTFADITMYAHEFGVTAIPEDHPDKALLSVERPYLGKSYDLIFCGGAVVRTHKRADYRGSWEAQRLRSSQLILAFQRIKPGGTLVVLMHQVDHWGCFCAIRSFDQFAEIQLFKPKNAHAIKSSFYLVARRVDLKHPEAIRALAAWKEIWYQTTFHSATYQAEDHGTALGTTEEETRKEKEERQEMEKEETMRILEDYGPRLIQLGLPIWKTQAEALEKLLKPVSSPQALKPWERSWRK